MSGNPFGGGKGKGKQKKQQALLEAQQRQQEDEALQAQRLAQEAIRKRSEILAFGARPTILGGRPRESSSLGTTLLVGRGG